MSERNIFIFNTLLFAFNATMIIVQIVLGACDDDYYDDREEDDDDKDEWHWLPRHRK